MIVRSDSTARSRPSASLGASQAPKPPGSLGACKAPKPPGCVCSRMLDGSGKAHSAGGVTRKDFALAHEIEDLATWLPEKGSPLEGFPKKWVR